jgi:energy-converting hydrogenase Eha subunit C
MNIARDDLKRLRIPLAVAIALLALGAACLIASGYYLDEARAARDASRLSRMAARERVSRVAEEERGIRDDLVYYEQMRQRGIVGEQSRLDWIESITRIKNERKLFEIRYNFDAQKPLDYPGLVATPSAEFVVSRLKLDMLLLHEGDLLNFLADLQAGIKAHVSVRSCNVTRIERGAAPGTTTVQPRLRAECQVDLVSVRALKPA